MRGSFTSGQFRFEVDLFDRESDKALGFCAYCDDDDFDLRLTRSGKLPNLDGAPVASWLLARIARLTDDRLGIGGKEDVDGGGYVLRFVVYLLPTKIPDPQQLLLFGLHPAELPVVPDRPVASFQFQGDMEGAAVLGYRVPDCPGKDILDALEAALLAAPNELMACELFIYDPEWEEDPGSGTYIPEPNEDSRNLYGWDGDEFLGKWNIRDAPPRRDSH